MSRSVTVAFAVLFTLVGAVSTGKVVHRARNGFGDHIAYYRAAERLAAGMDPYAPTGDTYVYLYPPVWAVMVRPLTLGGPAVFGAMWAVVLGASWLACRWLVQRMVPGLDGWRAVLPDLVITRFLLGAWSSGQVTLPLGVLLFGGLSLAHGGRGGAGGALVAVAASIKLYPALLAGALWRLGGARSIVTALVTGVAVTLSPIALVGPARFVELITRGFLGTGLANIESQRWWSGRCSPLATAWHIAGGEAGSGLRLAELAWAAVLLAAVVALWPRDPHWKPLWLGFAVLSMLVSTPMLGENYLALLMLPVAAMLVAPAPWRTRFAWTLAVSTVLMNIHSPLFVGRKYCDALERLGLSAIGLMLMWTSVAVALTRTLLTKAVARVNYHSSESEETVHAPDTCGPGG